MKGTLYICPTPIGNLEDITIRTINTLKSVDLIAAEDTRHTIKLLNHLGISKPLISYHEHNKYTQGENIINKLLNGENVALVSDAGMPGISDPGEDLIKLSIQNDINVIVLPGPSAFVNALVGSGISTSKFVFEGFLERDKSSRKKQLEKLKYEQRTIIFYESPHRLKSTLEDIAKTFGEDRNIAICRELTKKYEEYIRSDLKTALEIFSDRQVKGEFVLVLEGFKGEKEEINIYENLSIKEYVVKLMNDGIRKKDAIKQVAKERNLPKNEVYKEVLDIEK
ncbi:16S rRNA (cytidine1402-2'-O)-methyltransferase [Alkalithermobacter thermoalcaliphilus JW-YL-7 = DSM 7308]|uniref:Ribosomal RNA small subunit methyltransferase I n=1 Tax=Alkalithermobacter thermoalcaliphilus JW-YL-7 = DSM 7308 TaxID=1121328 RepID=A0A150FSN9_CLOPD|nr:Ribosomal RNA small subunit methyltransferase I [[Clostridium] paradoxum JW-YL-7 = DSM 7308]SHL19949.1 16S rRNA (cytidine1402-2'-O)-methyltransferase [[Clostridium] paradoxum JW-YL-7 = DSM 7308]